VITFPEISPEIVRIGPLALRWYSMMYVVGFIFAFHILKARIRGGLLKVPMEAADTYIGWLIIGMLLGARLVYVFVYNWDHYSMNPGQILAVWSGGLSFHGAMIGMITASLIFAWRFGAPGYSVLDTLAIGAGPGLFFGRIGNFINAELYGRATDVPWAMIFPTDPEKLPRHPSQLYQGLTEGLLVFFIVCFFQKRALKAGWLRYGQTGNVFVLGYGISRFFVEYTRQPDAQLGFVLGGLSMGQVLCLLMVVASLVIFWHIAKTQGRVQPKRMPDKSAGGPPNGFERFLARFVT
jgi:phosphatidylglycerol:prolipoprotein diacylglycerol transferase